MSGGLAGGGSVAVSGIPGSRGGITGGVPGAMTRPGCPKSPILLSPSYPGQTIPKTGSTKDVSFAPTVERCTYALDSMSEFKESYLLRRTDSERRAESLHKDGGANSLKAPNAQESNGSVTNLTSAENLGFNYQSMSKSKVRN